MISIKHLGYFIMVLFLSFLTSCIWEYPRSPGGLRIGNYPEWVGDETDAFRSASSWLSWKTEPHNIETVLPSTFKRDNFNGMFRIIDNGQNIAIEFDDGVAGCFLYIWVAGQTRENYDSTYSVKQENNNEFIYNGWARYSYDDSTELKSQSKYVYIGENNSAYSYRYILTINGMEIFNVIITAYKESAYAKNILPAWLYPVFYSAENKASNQLYYPAIMRLYLKKDPTGSKFVYNIIQDYRLQPGEVYDSILFFHGGVEQVALDNTNKLVKYELKGTSLVNKRKYVELKLVSEDRVKFSWLDVDGKLINEQITWIDLDGYRG